MKVIREFIKRKFNNFQDIFFYKKMFQGTKGYIAQMCMQYGKVKQNGGFTFFYLIPFYAYLFSLCIYI